MAVIRGIVSVLGRVCLCAIFFMSAVGNKIPNFNATAELMAGRGIPAPRFLLAGAIAFLIAGSISLVAGLWPRVGASLLLIFLVLATYYFHNFWAVEGAERQEQMIAFMKNLSLMGAMLMVIANGAGAWSLADRGRAAVATRPDGAV